MPPDWVRGVRSEQDGPESAAPANGTPDAPPAGSPPTADDLAAADLLVADPRAVSQTAAAPAAAAGGAADDASAPADLPAGPVAETTVDADQPVDVVAEGGGSPSPAVGSDPPATVEIESSAPGEPAPEEQSVAPERPALNAQPPPVAAEAEAPDVRRSQQAATAGEPLSAEHGDSSVGSAGVSAVAEPEPPPAAEAAVVPSPAGAAEAAPPAAAGAAAAGEVSGRRAGKSPWPWFTEKTERGSGGGAPAPQLPRRAPAAADPALPPPFAAPGAGEQSTFPLTSRLPVSPRPAFGGQGGSDGLAGTPAGGQTRLPPQRPSTTLPPVTPSTAADAAPPAPATPAREKIGQPTFDAFGPAPSGSDETVVLARPQLPQLPQLPETPETADAEPAEVPRWPGVAGPAAATASPAALALVDALLPRRLPSRGAVQPEPAPAVPAPRDLDLDPVPVNGSAAALTGRRSPARFEDEPTEVFGPLDVGLWMQDADGGGGPRPRRSGPVRRPRRARLSGEEPEGGDHAEPDPRRTPITAAVVEQARERASSRRNGDGSGSGPGPAKPRATPPATRGDRIRIAVRGFGQTLITLGVIVLLFVVYELWVTDLFNSRTQHNLGTALQKDWEQGDDPLVGSSPDGPARPGEKVSRIPLGRGIANIYIPAFGLDYVYTIVEGTNPDELNEGPGHYVNSVLPGQVGNFAIAGHRVGKGSPFLNLDKLRAGDAIVIETKSYWYTYRVLGNKTTGDPAGAGTLGIPGLQIVPPTDVDVIRPVPGGPPTARGRFPFITLTTCHPKFSARQRLIIHGQLEGKPWPKSQGDPPALQG